jgi:hypothetical protein
LRIDQHIPNSVYSEFSRLASENYFSTLLRLFSCTCENCFRTAIALRKLFQHTDFASGTRKRTRAEKRKGDQMTTLNIIDGREGQRFLIRVIEHLRRQQALEPNWRMRNNIADARRIVIARWRSL